MSLVIPMMRSKRMKRRRVNDRITCLPRDLVTEIIARLAAESPTPHADLEILRTTCKSFNEATKEKKVGRCVSLGKQWYLNWWWSKDRYLAFLERCADVGNPKANYVLGMEEVYNKNKKDLGLYHLKKAMLGGYDAAIYSMGIILFDSSATQALAIELLNGLSVVDCSCASTNVRIIKCQNEALSVLHKITMNKIHRLRRKPCIDPMCGNVVMKVLGETNEWWEEEEQRRFCSHLCRWTHEYNNFCLRI